MSELLSNILLWIALAAFLGLMGYVFFITVFTKNEDQESEKARETVSRRLTKSTRGSHHGYSH